MRRNEEELGSKRHFSLILAKAQLYLNTLTIFSVIKQTLSSKAIAEPFYIHVINEMIGGLLITRWTPGFKNRTF